MVIDPGSTIVGAVQGNSTGDALVLAAAPGSGTSTLHGFDDFFAGNYGFKYFDGFTTLSFASGAVAWLPFRPYWRPEPAALFSMAILRPIFRL